jgi:hypothetical protein
MQPTSNSEETARRMMKGIFLLGAAVLLLAVVVSWLRAWLLPESPSTSATASSMSAGSSEWNSFRYTYQWTDEGFLVTFTPFLPRNDDVVVGAMRHVAERHFNVRSTVAPSFMTENDRTFIVLGADGVMVMFLPIKEDTGEVHSFIVRRRG